MSSSALPTQVRVWIDGARVAPEEARVSVFDRGFLYGDSIFETLRTYGGRAFALDEHLARFEESARRVRIELPLARSALSEEIERAIRESGLVATDAATSGECYVRITVTRGVGALGLDPGNARAPLRVLLVGPLAPPAAEKYERGIRVVSFATSRVQDGTGASGAKVGNYLVAVLAMEKARANDADEALIVDAEGRVLEGSTSNLFWFEGDRLLTPGDDSGVLLGITRAHVLTAAQRAGFEVEYRTPLLSELAAADEVFISSSIREILPVVNIDGRDVQSGAPGARTRRLLDSFRRAARASVGLT